MAENRIFRSVFGDASSGGELRLLSIGGVFDLLRRGDLALALAVITIIVVLILPMPAFLLDIFLAISIIFSVLVLMTALFIQGALEFSVFPTVLLMATMLRLALNLASTRLILANGHQGTDAAGYVIEAFGSFVMRGNFVIGIIVFAILIIVNFVVITKGSGRIAEVAARFTLDAMPGKQMAIDADLSAGLINEEAAKQRRKNLEDESAFYGAMDGASKFVRGDAIAGLLITAINIVGGMIIGVAQQGMSFSDAGHTYTLLTVGDGLVSQIPALIVSTAAGLLVSKAGVSGATDKALVLQLSGYPKALGMSSFVMLVMAFLPGMPTMTFLLLSLISGYGSYHSNKAKTKASAQKALELRTEEKKQEQQKTTDASKELRNNLKIDELTLELGYDLLKMTQGIGADRLTEQIKALRKQFVIDFGFVMPSVRILDNTQIQANDYIIKVKEVEAGRGVVYPNHFMVMSASGEPIELEGKRAKEPTFGLDVVWVDASLREEATIRGHTVIDSSSVISTHLSEILKTFAAELLAYGDVQKLLGELDEEQKKLVDDIVPSQVSISGIQRVLQNLLNERVSIRDLPTILEGIAEGSSFSSSLQRITEQVRMRLSRQICAGNLAPGGYLPIISLSAEWEHAFAESLIGDGDDKQLAMLPSKLQELVTQIRSAFESAAREGELPVFVTSPDVRPYARMIIERFRPSTTVMSQNEIHSRIRLKTVGTV